MKEDKLTQVKALHLNIFQRWEEAVLTPAESFGTESCHRGSILTTRLFFVMVIAILAVWCTGCDNPTEPEPEPAPQAPPLLHNTLNFPGANGVTASCDLGLWMFDSQNLSTDNICDWLGIEHRGRRLLEPVNVVWIDFTAVDAADAGAKVHDYLTSCNFRIERPPLHSPWGIFPPYTGWYAGHWHDMTRDRATYVDADHPAACNHGRVFGSHQGVATSGTAFFTMGAFSRESSASTGHAYESFNDARVRVAEGIVDHRPPDDWVVVPQFWHPGNEIGTGTEFYTHNHNGVQIIVRYPIEPEACFEVTPSEGTTETMFTVDATCSETGSDESTELIYTCEWGDGSASQGSEPVANHSYDSQGTKTIRLIVENEWGVTDTAEQAITVTEVSVLFADDFESSGCLDKWIVGGRQAEGTNIADCVRRSGSTFGHLHKFSFTEITLSPDYGSFPYTDSLQFAFTMAAQTSSSGGAPSNYYGQGGVSFAFLGAGGSVGSVHFISATTNYPFDQAASNPAHAAIRVNESVNTSYSLSVHDLLEYISVDVGSITSVSMMFFAYSSTRPYPYVYCDVWIDDVLVTD